MKTKATETPEGDFILNGSKMFISGGGVSDLYIVMAKTGDQEVSAFLVQKNAMGRPTKPRSLFWKKRKENGLE